MQLPVMRRVALLLTAAVSLPVLTVFAQSSPRAPREEAAKTAADQSSPPAPREGAAKIVDADAVATEVDRLISAELQQTNTAAAPRTTDEDFLRRVMFDLAGTVPSPREATFFGLDPDPHKREKLIERLLADDAFAATWARYWREVIFSRATDMRARIMQRQFETWMAEQLQQNRSWDRIAVDLLTATGSVEENGETALIFAHGGQAAEIAAEASRIFLGIQIQCANCHDHPTDQWKREQFHELAAYFPRIRVQQVMNGERRSFEVVSANFAPGGRGVAGGQGFQPEQLFARLDRNRDGKLTKVEVAETQFARVFELLLNRGDADKDNALSLEEFKKLPRPDNVNLPGRGGGEYFMPDLTDPASRGTRVDPAFFVDGMKPRSGLRDVERREALARAMTSPENPWFAQAFVNRIWAELLGEGFHMPIDDIGPEREAAHPQVLEALSAGFIAGGYDVKWLFRTIANTEAYQRKIRARDPSATSATFAAAAPTRLRADQIYNAITKVLGLPDGNAVGSARGQGGFFGRFGLRGQFELLFGFDPSTPQEDVTGSVPQALFLMNSPTVNNAIRGDGNTRLAAILREFKADEDALNELYLLVLAREPSPKEIKLARDYIREVGNRTEAFEDLMWGLLNSSEFLSRR